MQYLGLRDMPIESLQNETLGLKPYIDSLTGFILRCETPMTIAIQGDWGSGKTSAMNLIKESLKSEPQIETVWFNTWQYSQFGLQDDLALSLLSHFVDAMGADAGTRRSIDMLKLGSKLLKKSLPLLGGLVGGELGDKVGDAVSKKIESFIQEPELDPAQQVAKLKNDIQKSVNNRIGDNPDKRVIVFIDDLDRLLPEKAVEVLEIFKLFMDVSGCVFVLAIDYNVVSLGIRQKFGTGADQMKDKSFFDKIIQLPFKIPVAQFDKKQYFNDLLSRCRVEYEESDLMIYEALVDYSVRFNPRGMKRLMNHMLLLNEVASKRELFISQDGANKRAMQRILFGILCMQTAYEDIYAYLAGRDFKNRFEDLLIVLELHDEFTAFSDEEGKDNKEVFDQEAIRLRTLLGDDEQGTKKAIFTEFMDAFNKAIQLDDSSDTSEEEWVTLRKMFSLSEITSLEREEIRSNATDISRKELESSCKNILKLIRKQYITAMRYKRGSDWYGLRGKEGARVCFELHTDLGPRACQ